MGRGNFGVVLRALDTRTSPSAPGESADAPPPPCREVAIKLLPRGDFVRLYRTYIKREMVHHSSLRHPMVISLREVFLTAGSIGMVMECARGGDLQAHIAARPERRLSEGEARWFFQQLAIGLDYCHQRGVANRDLKLDNLLLDVGGGGRPILKMCDFGYSKHEMNSMAKTVVGTVCYMAPEVLLGYRSYDAKVADMWSLGVVLFAMLFGCFPFRGQGRHYISSVIKGRTRIPPGVQVSSQALDLLGRLLVFEVGGRASMQQVLDHPWFLQDLPPGALDLNAALLTRPLLLEEVHYRIDHMVERAAAMGHDDEDPTVVTLVA